MFLLDVPAYTQEILEEMTGQDRDSIFLEFIKQQLDKDPQKRPSAKNLLDHKFLSDDYKKTNESYHHSTGHLSGFVVHAQTKKSDRQMPKG